MPPSDDEGSISHGSLVLRSIRKRDGKTHLNVSLTTTKLSPTSRKRGSPRYFPIFSLIVCHFHNLRWQMMHIHQQTRAGRKHSLRGSHMWKGWCLVTLGELGTRILPKIVGKNHSCCKQRRKLSLQLIMLVYIICPRQKRSVISLSMTTYVRHQLRHGCRRTMVRKYGYIENIMKYKIRFRRHPGNFVHRNGVVVPRASANPRRSAEQSMERF